MRTAEPSLLLRVLLRRTRFTESGCSDARHANIASMFAFIGRALTPCTPFRVWHERGLPAYQAHASRTKELQHYLSVC